MYVFPVFMGYIQLEFVVLLLSDETGACPAQPRDHAAAKKLNVRS